MPSPPVKAEATHHVLKTAGGGFRRDVEQAPDDNQSGGDAWLRGESNMERPLLVSWIQL